MSNHSFCTQAILSRDINIDLNDTGMGGVQGHLALGASDRPGSATGR